MKKFLFTLAALLMAGSAFAWEQAGGNNPTGDYFYAEDITLTEAQVANGASLTVPLNLHLDHYVSAYRLIFDYPEGVECIDGVESGESAEMAYTTRTGATRYFTPTVAMDPTGSVFIMQHMQQTYENGTAIGTAHYAPGEYEEILYLFLEIPAGFQGGTVTVTSEPASGKWTGYPDDIFVSGAQQITTFQINVPQAPPTPVVAPEPTIQETAEGVVAVCEGHTTVLMLNGQEEANIVNQPYALVNDSYTEDLVLNFYAYTVAGTGEDQNSPVVGPFQVIVPHKTKADVAAPVITYETTATQVIVNIQWPESDGQQQYNGQMVYDRPAYGQPDESYNVEAYITEGPTCNESTHGTAVIPVPAQAPQWQAVAAPSISTTMDDNNVYVTIEWPTTTGNHVYTGELTYPRGDVDADYDVVAYTEADYPYSESAHLETTIHVPAKVVTPPVYDETALAPNSGYAITGTEVATVTITNREEGATVYYALYAADENHQPVGEPIQEGSFTGDSYSFDVTGDGSYVVVAYAHIDGKNDSADGGVFFTILENEQPPVPSGIDELANGKQIAGVRYFNMAGQEMQEVNGITIVVTTYTDGTTSTAKVMK